MRFSGTLIDLHAKEMYPAHIDVSNGRIESIERTTDTVEDQYLLPGFIDAHVHIESSMLPPSEFARLAVVHGTVGTVSDPHEIANVCGVDGIHYMIDNGARVPFHFAFGAPSCVPATQFETAGATVTPDDIDQLFAAGKTRYLSEVMNWPGVLNGDPDMLAKIDVARRHGMPIDGHAPGMRSPDVEVYASRHITTDHECVSLEEALDKISAGMKILIREGSAAKNYNALHTLLGSHPDRCMFCSDDMHPDALVRGHIDLLVRRSIDLGYDLYDVLRAACIAPIEHYRLDVGQLRVGDSADFIVVNSIEEWNVRTTVIRGHVVADGGSTCIEHLPSHSINNFSCNPVTADDVRHDDAYVDKNVRVIRAHNGEIMTTAEECIIPEADGTILEDVLPIVVVNRYSAAPVAKAYVRGFGFSYGAIASTVAHDSHNIIAVGTTSEGIAEAINAIIEMKGGIAVVHGFGLETMPLDIAGLMSSGDGYEVARRYEAIDAKAKLLGSRLDAPFMTLSFMALLVIPQLKLSDKGLFDGTTFSFVSNLAT